MIAPAVRISFIVLAMAALACGSKEDPDRNGDPPKGEGGAAAPTKEEPKTTVADLFNDTKPAQLVGIAAKFELGKTSVAEARKVDPKLVDAIASHEEEGFGGVQTSLRYRRPGDDPEDKRPITGAQLSFMHDFGYQTQEDVYKAIEAAWGKPVEGPDFNWKDQKAFYWFDAAKGVRARLLDLSAERAKMGYAPRLYYTRYMPLEKLLGAPGKPFGFEVEGKALLDLSVPDCKAVYHYEAKEGMATPIMGIPPTEFTQDRTQVMPFAKEGKVNRYSVSLKYKHNPKGAADIAAALAKKYPGKDFSGDEPLVISETPKVQVLHQKGSKQYIIEVGG